MNARGLRIAIFAAAAVLAWPAPSRSGAPNWPDHLAIATASPGGTYYVYGEALAKILTRALDLPVTREPTEGPSENIERIEAGEIKLGFVTTGIALAAWNATGVWAGKRPARSMRAIFPMYDTPFQLLVPQDAGTRSVAEMAGKRGGGGPGGGTSVAYFPQFFDTLKIPVSLTFGEWAELAAQLHQRELDVLAVAAGVPFPSFAELEVTDKVRYIAVGPDPIGAFRTAL